MSDNELPNANFATIERMQLAAKNPNSGPVFMLNLNKYSSTAGFPDGALSIMSEKTISLGIL